MQSFFQAKYLWGILILILCSIPGPQIPEVPLIPHLDKLVHAYLYGQWIWFWRPKQQQNTWIWISRTIRLMVFGLCMELWQHYVIPFRSFEVADLFANLSGCILGIILSQFKH